MILRRFSQALKDQNWTTILVEFVLLVAGVFLGIQAANWNETRRERALEAEYIARLQRDFGAIDARRADVSSTGSAPRTAITAVTMPATTTVSGPPITSQTMPTRHQGVGFGAASLWRMRFSSWMVAISAAQRRWTSPPPVPPPGRRRRRVR